MTPEQQKGLFSGIAKFTKQEIARAVKSLERTIAEMQRDLQEMKAISANFGYRGVWTEGSEYERGNFVTHDGSLFHCNLRTKNRPGRDPVSWSLCVKRGQDGGDASGRAA